MNSKNLFLVAVLVLGLAATGCASKQMEQSVADLEQKISMKDQEITTLQSSIQTLESDLNQQKSMAQQKAESAMRSERALDECRGEVMKARDAKPAAPMMTAAAGELLPPNAQPGECYARVFVPPTYGTETVKVLKRDASERVEIIPAKYEWVEERVLVKDATRQMEEVPAQYDWVEEKILVKPATTVWKKGRGPIERVDHATGEIMCLVEEPAVYKTVKKKVLVKSASTRSVEIPAEYKTVKVKKMVSPPQEKRITIPAEYETITKTVLLTDGRMAWREVLCQTNMTPNTVVSIQRALDKAGYNPGPIDGVYGPKTRAAVRAFQQAKGLSTGGLTMRTISQLGVKI